jgi:hypothetical protein
MPIERQLGVLDFGGQMKTEELPPTPEQLRQADYTKLLLFLRQQNVSLGGKVVIKDLARHGDTTLVDIDDSGGISFPQFPPESNVAGVPDYQNYFSGLVVITDELPSGKNLKGACEWMQRSVFDAHAESLVDDATVVAVEKSRQVGGQYQRWMTELRNGVSKTHRKKYLMPTNFSLTQVIQADGYHIVVSERAVDDKQALVKLEKPKIRKREVKSNFTQYPEEEMPWFPKTNDTIDRPQTVDRRQLLSDAITATFGHHLCEGEYFVVRELGGTTAEPLVGFVVEHPQEGLRRSDNWQVKVRVMNDSQAIVLQSK